MNKLIISIIIVILVIILGLFSTYSINQNDDEDRVILTVSSEGPIELSEITENIHNNSYYKGYDNETLKWMESLGQKSVFVSEDEFVIMSPFDASKLHSEYITDAYITEDFSCKIMENHSLGNNSTFKNVLYVKDVEYINEEIHYFDV